MLEALDVWKGPGAMEVRVDLEPNSPAPFAEGDVLLVFLERGETLAGRYGESTEAMTREELLEAGVDEVNVAQLLEENVKGRESALRFEKWAAGRWLHVSNRMLPESDAERDALEKLIRAAARLQAGGTVSFEDRIEWLVSVVEQPAFRDEALYSLLPDESSLTSEQLARLAGAFLRAPAVDASDILMLDLLARYPGAEVDMAAASVIEAALRMARIPAWATPMVAAALHRYGDDFSERIGRDDRGPFGPPHLHGWRHGNAADHMGRRPPRPRHPGSASGRAGSPGNAGLRSVALRRRLTPVLRFPSMKPKRYVRLTEPMVRDGGTLRPASWDEALDRAAEGFRRVREARGGEAIGLFSCSKATNEVNYLAQKFARVALGSNNIDSCNRT